MVNLKFPKLWGKNKFNTNDEIDKLKNTADGFVKASKEKAVKNAEPVEKKPKPGKKEKLPKKNTEPRVKLDNSLRMAVNQYNDAYTMMNDNGTALYLERIRAADMIALVEDLVNSIANRPKEFDTEISKIETDRESFIGACEFAKAELDAAKKSVLGAGAGVAAGAAIVGVAPTVAMWTATTFGTASTGTAISALSGAAATNAALAWLGGGALAAGGGGMVAGHALLALAGPIGWGIAGLTLLSSIVLFSLKKMNLFKKKNEEIEAVKNNSAIAQKVAVQIQELLDDVITLRDNISQQYRACLACYGRDFMSIPREQQIQLGTLVNNTNSLATSLGRRIQQ